jgi:4a-hydroxytetrahydrobiopterin dehydratase
MPTPLTPTERSDFAAEHPDWEMEGETITREFRFTDFAEAMGFVTRTALAAEAMDHHPDIDIRWNTVTLTLSTHSVGALTELDRELAGTIAGFVA